MLDGSRDKEVREREEREQNTETVNESAQRWLKWRRGSVSSAPENLRPLRRVLDLIGRKRILDVTPEDMKRAVRMLDKLAEAGEISPKTAINDWATVQAMFRDASGGTKAEELIVSGLNNPTAALLPPDKGVEQERQYLYPQDVIDLFSLRRCPPSTGHSTYAMLDRYDHEADDRNVGDLFPALGMLCADDGADRLRPIDGNEATIH
jgi:hypothetical protein